MMIAFVGVLLHITLGVIAALYWVNRVDPQGEHMGKELLVGLLAFLFCPLALLAALIDYIWHYEED